MAQCETLEYLPDYAVITPHNGARYRRGRPGHLVRCERPAILHVRVCYSDGMTVEKNLCQQCANNWHEGVVSLEQRLPASLRTASVWTYRAVAAVPVEVTS
jgi:hypothetical protein